MYTQDTIVAKATASGQGGVGIVRLSGPKAYELGLALTKRAQLKPRYAHKSFFYDHRGELLDDGIVIYFKNPHSYTGEDVIELQGHGGPWVAKTLILAACELGARLAEPGEFTQRAFLNDKMDLSQAEAVASLIEASSEKAVKACAQSLTGAFSNQVKELNQLFIHLRMYVEAAIDFPEEEIDFLADDALLQKARQCRRAFNQLMAKTTQGAMLADGVHVAIIGCPNAGKSSLLNLWSGMQAAIVTDVAGTTRDVIEKTVFVEGVPVKLIDTAGIRMTDDEVERIGIEKAKEVLGQAQWVLWLQDDSQPSANAFVADVIKSLDVNVVSINNKIDVTGQKAGVRDSKVYISAKTGEGFEEFLSWFSHQLGIDSGAETGFIARARHVEILNRVDKHLKDAMNHLQSKTGELMAEELRLASEALSAITGEFTSDDLLGEIFSNFCIGK